MKDKLPIALGLALIDFLFSFALYTFFIIGSIFGIANNIIPSFDLNWPVALAFWILLLLLRFNVIKYLAKKTPLPKPLKAQEVVILAIIAVILEAIVLYLIDIPPRELFIYSFMGFALMFYHLTYSVSPGAPSPLDRKRIIYQSLAIIVIGLIIQLVLKYFQSQ